MHGFAQHDAPIPGTADAVQTGTVAFAGMTEINGATPDPAAQLAVSAAGETTLGDRVASLESIATRLLDAHETNATNIATILNVVGPLIGVSDAAAQEADVWKRAALIAHDLRVLVTDSVDAGGAIMTALSADIQAIKKHLKGW